MDIKELISANDKPRLGFGAMRLPVIDRITKEIDRTKGAELIDTAIKLGVNYFDTAYGYHKGESEKLLGEVLKKYDRKSYFFTTKLPIWKVNSISRAKEIFFTQLKRLNTDYIDLYMIHNWEGENRYNIVNDLKIIDFLNDLKAQGYIHNIGFSYHDVPQVLEKRLDLYPWDAVQLQINYIDWDLQNAKEMHRILTDRDICIIAMEPVRGGTLAELNEDKRKIFKLANPNLTPAAYALKWVMSQTKCKIILSGMSNITQLEENVKLFSDYNQLTPKELLAIEQVKNCILNSENIFCTSCNYCSPCTVGIDIPELIKLLNRNIMGAGLAQFGHGYEEIIKYSNSADKCIKCGKCEKRCPQGIKIVETLNIIQSRYNQYLDFH